MTNMVFTRLPIAFGVAFTLAWGGLFLASAGGQTPSAQTRPAAGSASLPTSGPTSAPAGGAKARGTAEYKWLILDNTIQSHKITVDINGQRFAEFTKQGGGFESKPSPFKEGSNEVVVVCSPMDPNAGERVLQPPETPA